MTDRQMTDDEILAQMIRFSQGDLTDAERYVFEQLRVHPRYAENQAKNEAFLERLFKR